MKKLGLLLCTLVSFLGNGQDEILGTWLNEEKDGKIFVYKQADEYFGRVTWIEHDTNDDGTSPRLDSENPDSKLAEKPIVGLIILENLEWDDDDNEWDDGEIYDPRSGNTYSCYAKLEDDDTLFLKGYIGFSLIGRSTLWTRVK